MEDHGETDRSFRSKLERKVFHCARSSEQLRWAVAPIREQQRNSEHPAFLTDGTDSDVDPRDSEQLFLPGFLFDLFFCHGFAGSEELAA